jgi:hypothetical protein
MKKKLIFAAAFVLIAWSFVSCEFQKCKMCATNIYENGSLTIPGSEAEYCGTDLVTKEAVPDITVGNLVTKVECR